MGIFWRLPRRACGEAINGGPKAKAFQSASSLAVPDDLVCQRRASRNQAHGEENTPGDDRGQCEGGQTLQHDRSPTLLTWVGFKRFARSSASWAEILDAKAGAWGRRTMMRLGEDGVSTHPCSKSTGPPIAEEYEL